ncbi:hypothetical protein QFZ58_003799 [Streptomyces sp. B1I3]|nr:hypothetical protein [Streptomyces sp. B1I3]
MRSASHASRGPASRARQRTRGRTHIGRQRAGAVGTARSRPPQTPGQGFRHGPQRAAGRRQAGSPVAIRSSKWAPRSDTAAPEVGNWSMTWSSA